MAQITNELDAVLTAVAFNRSDTKEDRVLILLDVPRVNRRGKVYHQRVSSSFSVPEMARLIVSLNDSIERLEAGK